MNFDMLQSNEITTLLLGSGALLFLVLNFRFLKNIPSRWLLYTAFALNFCSWAFTNLEALFWPVALNIVEHICSTLDIALFVIWLVVVVVRHKGRTA